MFRFCSGTSVVTVAATDADDPTYGNSARLIYSIVQGQPYFSVEPKTGDDPIVNQCDPVGGVVWGLVTAGRTYVVGIFVMVQPYAKLTAADAFVSISSAKRC